ncbi:RHS repeat protein [Massilia horti]|uniref:RHS repeat protein n=1 Tax=Massilia horti TaxID=2562153 RepID=A0A4Y9SU20_9BURK|nr:RHS repeat protein [Massilia horti]TFW30200.1 RHS repeat protein [Massilia horti]
MRPPNLMHQFATVLSIFLCLFGATSGHAETVEPRYIFTNDSGAWPTLFDAREALTAQYLKQPNAWWFIPGDMVPNGTPSTLNGQLVWYTLNLTVSPTNPNPPNPPGPASYSSVKLIGDCPVGFTAVSGTINNDASRSTIYCTRPDPCDCKMSAGNPIEMSGAKIQREDDYVGPGLLQFSRIYRSDRGGWSNNFNIVGIDPTSATNNEDLGTQLRSLPCIWGIGTKIKQPYCYRQTNRSIGMTELNAPGYEFIVQRPNQRAITFGTTTNLNPKADVNDRAVQVFDLNGAALEWQVYNAQNDTTEVFDPKGKLIRVQIRGGRQLTMQYSDDQTPQAIAPKAGLLIEVSDTFGRHLGFTYDAQGRISTLIDPAGGIIQYAYDEASSFGPAPAGNLTSVTYQDGKKRIYWYNEPENTGGVNLPQALTGITDELGVRYATYKYNSTGKAISTEHAGGVEKYTFAYPSETQATVTDPLNSVRNYNSKIILNTSRDSNSNIVVNGSTRGTFVGFDANGNVSSFHDLNSVLTTHNYDLSRNLETRRTESGYDRTITTTWHPTFRLPLRIAEPSRLTTFSYDANGLLLSKKIQATTDTTGEKGLSGTLIGIARQWTYEYNTYGQLVMQSGPRTDVSDQIRYDYDASGNLTSIVNAAGHTTLLSNYDAHGRPGTITAPNGVSTNLSYSPRGWLVTKSTSVGGVTELTSYDYDGVGQLKSVTFPDGSSVTYTYDDAHRLTDLADSLGNAVHYSLDNMGNRIGESTRDPSGTLTRQITRVYNSFNYLQSVTGGVQ